MFDSRSQRIAGSANKDHANEVAGHTRSSRYPRLFGIDCPSGSGKGCAERILRHYHSGSAGEMNQPERLLVTRFDSNGAGAITPGTAVAQAKPLAFISKDLDFV